MRNPPGRPPARQGSVPSARRRIDPARIFDDDFFGSLTDADKTDLTRYWPAALHAAVRGGPSPPVPPTVRKLQATR